MTKQNLEKCLIPEQETYPENPDSIGDIYPHNFMTVNARTWVANRQIGSV